MICFLCHYKINVELDILNMFQKAQPLCNDCEKELRAPMLTHYSRPHEVTSFLDYNPAVKELFHRYKFMGDFCLREVLAIFIEIKMRHYDFIIPVSLSKERLQERGYNQVTGVLECLKIKYTDCLVSKSRQRQSELTKEERLRSPNPFIFKQDFDVSRLQGQRILIVDDIYTTGMTINHVIEVLKEGAPSDIKVLTFSKV